MIEGRNDVQHEAEAKGKEREKDTIPMCACDPVAAAGVNTYIQTKEEEANKNQGIIFFTLDCSCPWVGW